MRIEEHTKTNLTHAADKTCDELSEVLEAAKTRLSAMRDTVGERDINNLYVFDSIQACLYLTTRLDRELNELIVSMGTI